MQQHLRLAVCVLAMLVSVAASAADRPNILWITAEDMSPALGCYGDEYAVTPHIDRLASESVRFTHAFATAPVCSPVRSCLITGVYATSLGTHNMRSAFPIPDHIHGFPSYLRMAGYYTTNNVKTDYNTSSWQRLVEESWDESSNTAHWRKRPDARRDQPFFSVFNLMTSHQSRSMVWTYDRFVNEVQSRLTPDEIHDPANAPLPPYYPDTPVIRKTVARFYDCVTAMDKEVGAILQQLEDDGLADDTIVFFYSDHGSGMPRHKRALLDSGMHVPLLIRIPEKYRRLAPAGPGETIQRLVSFVDFPPTVLGLAHVDIPDHMQGKPFLGPVSTERQYAFGHRDRVDEAIDLARSVRDKRFLYIRNYMPHLGYNQPTAWPDLGEIRHEFYRLTNPHTMTAPQWYFAGPTRRVEELYDCEKDPQNLHNLAGSEKYADILGERRSALLKHMQQTNDLGFIPESLAWELFGDKPPWSVARREQFLWHTGGMQAAAGVGAVDEQSVRRGFDTTSPVIDRYWAAMSAAGLPSLSEETVEELQLLLNDPSPDVRIAVASALARHGHPNDAIPVLIEAVQHDDLTVVLHAARAIEMLGDTARAAIPAMRDVLTRAEQLRPSDTPATFVLSGEQDLAMFASFAARGFLERVDVNEQDNWLSLFDGRSLDGWTPRADGEVNVKDGEIQILAKGKNLWLVHEGQFDNFELTVEALMPESGYNSGIGFRCTGTGTGKGKPKGYQCEIENLKSGMIYAIGSGWVWPKGAEETARFKKMAGGCFRVGEWNRFRIRCEGSRIRIHINDTLTADVTDDRFIGGSIALQHHGKGAVHRFRNIRIRKLGPAK